MINAFNTSKTGVKNYQHYLDAIANNIANANTDGFNAQKVNFTDLVYTESRGTDIQIGNGSKIIISNDLTQGNISEDNSGINAIINGDGFFAVGDADGNVSFTRIGKFTTHEINGENYLMTAMGDFVLDENLSAIKINNDYDINLTSPGNPQANAIVLGLFSVAKPESLIPSGNGKFVLAEGITPMLDNNSTIINNSNESSNVSLIDEMSKMITAQRGFQLNAQMIKTADELEQSVNNLRN